MDEVIRKYLFRGSHALEFEIVDLPERLETKGEMMTVPHRAQFYHILWIEKGSAIHTVDFKPCEITDDTLLFIPHNCVNSFDKNGSYHGRTIIFTDGFYCRDSSDHQFLRSSILFSDLYPIARLKVNPDMTKLRTFLAMLEDEYAGVPDATQHHMIQNMLHLFLLQAERELRKQGFEELKPGLNLEYLMAFRDLLEEQFHKERSVSHYAAAMHISVKQLNKATGALLDKSPKQIIDERVMLEAKRLLVHSNMPVKEIGYELGFNEPTNFIKYFKKHSGSTPAGFQGKN